MIIEKLAVMSAQKTLLPNREVSLRFSKKELEETTRMSELEIRDWIDWVSSSIFLHLSTSKGEMSLEK